MVSKNHKCWKISYIPTSKKQIATPICPFIYKIPRHFIHLPHSLNNKKMKNYPVPNDYWRQRWKAAQKRGHPDPNDNFKRRWKMDSRRWVCLMAALMIRLTATSESLLSSAAFNLIFTTSWLTSSWIENIFGKSFKILPIPPYCKNSVRPNYIASARNLWGNLIEEIKRGQAFVGINLHFHTRFPPWFLFEGYIFLTLMGV